MRAVLVVVTSTAFPRALVPLFLLTCFLLQILGFVGIGVWIAAFLLFSCIGRIRGCCDHLVLGACLMMLLEHFRGCLVGACDLRVVATLAQCLASVGNLLGYGCLTATGATFASYSSWLIRHSLIWIVENGWTSKVVFGWAIEATLGLMQAHSLTCEGWLCFALYCFSISLNGLAHMFSHLRIIHLRHLLRRDVEGRSWCLSRTVYVDQSVTWEILSLVQLFQGGVNWLIATWLKMLALSSRHMAIIERLTLPHSPLLHTACSWFLSFNLACCILVFLQWGALLGFTLCQSVLVFLIG